MKHPRTRLLKLGLAISVALLIAACSDDSEAEPQPGSPEAQQQETQREESQREETQAADRANAPPAGQSAKVVVQPGEKFALKVSNGSYLSTVLPGMYRERCLDEAGDEVVCGFLRRLLMVELTMALEEIERSRDQRGADEALKALALDQEPQVLIAALRVLGQFPDTPGIADKVLPLILDSPWTTVQEFAARVLRSNPDAELAAIGALWGGNHSTLYAEHEYAEYPDFAPHYLDMGFPEYPDAEWFSPADSDRSVGWWTDDDFATVVEWLSAELDVEPRTYQQWTESLQAQTMAAMGSIDQTKQAEVERLMAEFTKTQDMALLEKMQKLQEEMYAPMQNAVKISEMGVDNIRPVSLSGVFEAARFFIAEEKDGHVARMVLVYPLPGVKRTVIQEAWNMLDYPSAWPAVASQQE